ncbi:glycosyl transferase, group 1 [Pyrobaculum islandicum DSM 4184]|uniref:Glycosyl transferase, group 1 n=1 Tax=Pyrobaculum islandicum (strain DSM 4184 / JCM 9189 / GEO3) TaxID=384616 RepID=A1RUM1_PYRIL|nr:glycosyltransferase family 4 protein [Pyrobaculum islandicum]ABL88653.1 glycosyl transferase, group 1 [Pyrobaculum islandicum DSM 4184]
MGISLAIYSVLNVGYGGGFERWLYETVSRFSARGYKITVITTKAGRVRDAKAKSRFLSLPNVNLVELNNADKPFTIPTDLRKFFKTLSDAELLYFNNAFAANELLAYLARKFKGLRVISGYLGTFHNVGGFARMAYHTSINLTVSRHFDAHHVLNKERLNWLKSLGYKNIYYIPPGVDLNKFRPIREKAETFTVLFVGRLEYQKGFDMLAEAIHVLNIRDREKIRFLICGDGSLATVAELLTSRYDNVHWKKWCEEKELIEMYSTSHITVAPSRYGYEEFLLVPLESMACGTPAVTTDIPGPREYVRNFYNGLRVPLDKEYIKYAIEFFKNIWYKNRELYFKYIKNALDTASAFDWNKVINKLDNMFRHVLCCTETQENSGYEHRPNI